MPHYPLRVFFQSPDATKENPKLFGDLLEGFPVQMSEPWGEMYFPDHWALALACPNVPVVIDCLLERIPPVQNAYVQLIDHLTLENIKREDTFTRFPEPDHAISFVWALLNPAFGMHGVRMQYEALYLGGMRDAEDTSAFVPREPDNLVKLLELVPAAYVAPPVQSPSFVDFRPSTAIKPLKQHMHYVADAPHYTVKMSKEAIWLNKASVTFYPQSARGPFKVAVTKPVVQRADFQFEYHVSNTTQCTWRWHGSNCGDQIVLRRMRWVGCPVLST